jgi:hypothetical protein
MNKILKLCSKGIRKVTAKIDGDRRREKEAKEKAEKDKGKK